MVHPGSHGGVGAQTAATRVARQAVAALDAVTAETGRVCDLLPENTAGAGGTVGRTFAELAEILGAVVGMDRLRCLHLNDSKVPFGANRDRRENLGEGTIGRRGLAAIPGQPDLQGPPPARPFGRPPTAGPA